MLTRFVLISCVAPGWGIRNEVLFAEDVGLFNSDHVILLINDDDLHQRINKDLPDGYYTKRPLLAIEDFLKTVLKTYPQLKAFLPILDHPKIDSIIDADKKKTEAVFRENSDAVLKLAQMVGEKGAKFIVAHLELPKALVSNRKYYSDSREKFQRKMMQNNIPYFRFALVHKKEITSKYFYDEVHPNPLGNDAIAEILAEKILSYSE